MPLYEYECDKCRHRFEVIQKFSDPLVDICPKCGGAVRKLISSPAFQFKGSGFYITDYPKTDSAGNAKDGGEAKEKESKEKESKDKESKQKDSKDKTSSGADKDSAAAKADKSSASETPAATPAPAAAPAKKD